MLNPFLVIALSAAAAIAVFSQTSSKTSADNEQAVLKVTQDWLDAEEKNDRAMLQRIIADDFQGTAARGNTVFKEDILPAAGSQGGLSLTVSDLKARLFGDTAVVSGHGLQKAGEKREMRFTVVYVKRDNRWQMVAGHLSAIPKQ